MSAAPSALATLALLAILAGCGGDGEPMEEETEATPAWVTELAEVANAIEARPGATDSVLAAHDMTRVAFDSLIYEVAADPELTAAYQAARQ